MSLSERSLFTKKLADGLMLESGGTLLNDISDYEVELRLIEKKSGGFLPLLKFSNLPDRRFAYRRKSIAASMQPALAAILMELAKPYQKEKARVLDPFCGVGTLLFERNYALHADTLYGVDVFGQAIQGARENAAAAGIPATLSTGICGISGMNTNLTKSLLICRQKERIAVPTMWIACIVPCFGRQETG